MSTLPGVSSPSRLESTLAAARLGWALAEVRGHVRELAPIPPTKTERPKGFLPLEQERSGREQLVEYFELIANLASELGVNPPTTKVTKAPPAEDKLASDWFRHAAWRAANPPDTTAESIEAARQGLLAASYSWDAHILDVLAAQPAPSAAYQLARAVAEIRWGFDPNTTDPDEQKAAAYLMGPKRGALIDRLLTRLHDDYDPLTLHALQTSLLVWRTYGADVAAWSTQGWQNARAEQATIWHDLVTGQRDGLSLIDPHDIVGRPEDVFEVIRKFWPEFLALVIGAAVLAAGAALLTTSGASEALGAALGTLGLTGVTAAGISAKARSSALDLLTVLRRDLYRGLVAEKALVAPAGPGRSPA